MRMALIGFLLFFAWPIASFIGGWNLFTWRGKVLVALTILGYVALAWTAFSSHE